MPVAPLPLLSELEHKMMQDHKDWFEKLYGNDEAKKHAHVMTACGVRPSDRKPSLTAVVQYVKSVEAMFNNRPELVEKLVKENGYDLWGLTVTQGCKKDTLERFLLSKKESLLEIPRFVRLHAYAIQCDDPEHA